MKFGPNTTQIYIPLDLQINILLRLPVKSLLRFRCVSKLWCSIITSHDFRNRHFNITSSSAPPRLLIAFQDFYGEKLLLVSSPNPNVSSSSTSSCCVPYKDLSKVEINGRKVYNAVWGLTCFESRLKVGICNPSTRELHMFPQIKFKNYPDIFPCIMYFLGSETYKNSNVPSKLLPMDTSDNFWTANCNCFIGDKTLINYNGKIGVVEKPQHGRFRMWVVEDAEKEEWSMNTFYLPQSASGLDFKVMNTFYTGEICLVTEKISDPFCLFYYNLKTNSMRSVTYEGLLHMATFKQALQFSVSYHYESLVSLET
ncbi:putative protein [Arabidopsis thaliana]|nr:putative protein [Arabidopsis thaliana]